LSIETKPIAVSGGVILSLIFSTWVLITVVLVCYAERMTEYRMRIERLEDESMGINMPVTQTIKDVLTNK